MDWRVLLTTFGVVFLAEMGDKTQIAAMTMAAEKKRPWEVFIAAGLDYAWGRRELHCHWSVGIVRQVLEQQRLALVSA